MTTIIFNCHKLYLIVVLFQLLHVPSLAASPASELHLTEYNWHDNSYAAWEFRHTQESSPECPEDNLQISGTLYVNSTVSGKEVFIFSQIIDLKVSQKKNDISAFYSKLKLPFSIRLKTTGKSLHLNLHNSLSLREQQLMNRIFRKLDFPLQPEASWQIPANETLSKTDYSFHWKDDMLHRTWIGNSAKAQKSSTYSALPGEGENIWLQLVKGTDLNMIYNPSAYCQIEERFKFVQVKIDPAQKDSSLISACDIESQSMEICSPDYPATALDGFEATDLWDKFYNIKNAVISVKRNLQALKEYPSNKMPVEALTEIREAHAIAPETIDAISSFLGSDIPDFKKALLIDAISRSGTCESADLVIAIAKDNKVRAIPRQQAITSIPNLICLKEEGRKALEGSGGDLVHPNHDR